jgi:putative N-acetylmannosamine-6-phosphate epimerase
MVPTLPRGLIVSCQAYEGEPLFGAAIMAAMARAALQGGAVAIRANGPDDIAAIRAITALPIVGLFKQHHPGVPVYITPTQATAEAIVAAGCDWVALDATPRARPGGEQLAPLVRHIQATLKRPVMADVSCLDDAARAEALGVACVSTTLAGYTEHGRPALPGPDLEFLAQLVAVSRVPVVAEGRFRTPEQVRAAFEAGAHAVVVGSAITRPWEITRWFVEAIPSPAG